MSGNTPPPVFSSVAKFIGVFVLCAISGTVGGAVTRNFGTSNYNMSYADFISIMLTGISLLMTVLAIFLAILGFIGWTTIEQKVHSKTEDFLKTGFEKGGRLDRAVIDVIERKTSEIMFDGVQDIDEAEPNEDGADANQAGDGK